MKPVPTLSNGERIHIPVQKFINERLPYTDGHIEASSVCFVGEAPGALEEKTGRAFVGSSGALLRDIIKRECKLDLTNDCYVTNVVKARPKDNNIDKYIREHPQAFRQFLVLLDAELAHSKAKIFVPVGNLALQVLTGKMGITKWRGSLLHATLPSIAGRKCMPMIHPAATLRNWKTSYPTTILDARKLHQQRHTDTILLPHREYVIRPNYLTTITVLEDILNNPKTKYVSVDTETRYGRIVSIQLATSAHFAIAIPFVYKNGYPYWELAQEQTIWFLLRRILEDGKLKIIGQNFITYDTFVLWQHGFDAVKVHANTYMDTMFAMQCYQPQLPKGLDYLTSIYTNEPYYKDEGKEWSSTQGENEFWTYGCKDVCVVAEIAPQQQQDLMRAGQWEFFQERYMRMSRMQLKMSMQGLQIDSDKKNELIKQYRKQIIVAQAETIKLFGKNVNVNSPAQMKKLLYEDLKLPKKWTLNTNGEYTLSCNRDSILELATETNSPALRSILKVRELRTLYSNNLTAIFDSDGRIRCSFGFTETGRWTSYSNPMGTGGNIQNWNKKMRVMVVAPPGFSIISGDLSQAEARVVAWRARDTTLIDIFLSGKDIHSETAALIFDKPVAEIDHATERYLAKRIVHASNYDMKAKRFAISYNADVARFNLPLPFMDVPRAQELQTRYLEKVPNLRNVYQHEIQQQISNTKRLTNPFGRTCMFHDRLGPDLFREGFAFYAQSTVADVTNTILLMLDEHTTSNEDFVLFHQMHDGILAYVRDEHIEMYADLMLTFSQKVPLKIEERTLIIPMEIEVGKSWDKMKRIR